MNRRRSSAPPTTANRSAVLRPPLLRPRVPTAQLIALALPFAMAGCGGESAREQVAAGVVFTPAPPPGTLRDSPLPQREAPPASDAPLFEKLEPAETGIDFVHRWAPRDAVERDQLGNAFAGGGVALGDVDGDRLPDVLLTRPHGGPRLFRNRGDFRFEDVTDSALPDLGGHWSTGATFADVDNDGDLDLYLCGYRSPSRMLRNDGRGRFADATATSGLSFAGAAVIMAFADYDRDGDLDGYLLTNRLAGQPAPENLDVAVVGGKVIVPPEHRENVGALVLPDGSLRQIFTGQADRLFRNNGDGTFVDVSADAGIDGCWHGLSATWWDHDGDGFPDLYVSNDFYGPDHLYHNNRDGTFTDIANVALPHTPWFSMGSDAGDLDNDGLPDFIATDMAATSHYKQKVNMGDMDENGWFLESAEPRQYMRNAVYVHSGTDRFLEAAHLTGMSSTDWTWAVKILDLDEDGRQDVYFTNGMTRPFFHADLRQEIRRLHAETGENLWHTKERQDERNLCFRNLGDLAFERIAPAWGLDHLGVTFGAAAGDLDRDGDIDLVGNNFEGAPLVYRNRSSVHHRVAIRLWDDAGNRHAVGAKIDLLADDGSRQTRHLQPTRGFMGCDDTLVTFGLGDSPRIRELRISWPGPSRREQVFRDLAADRLYEISAPGIDAAGGEAVAPTPAESAAVASPLFARLSPPGAVTHSERAFDDFAREPLLPNRLSALGPALACADVDGDGDTDLFLGGAAGRPGALLIGEGTTGEFVRASTDAFDPDAECEDLGAIFVDADSDGDPDLYVVSGGVEADPGTAAMQDRLYLNDGSGAFHRASADSLPDLAFSGSCVAAADPDRDGDYDLFLGGRIVPGRYPMAPGSRLLVNNGGVFTDATASTAPRLAGTGMVTAAIWTDADGDGWVDLLVAEEYGPIRLYRNADGRLEEATEAAGLAGLDGWWNGIAGADIDRDGDIDLVATNFGLNTKYHVSSDAPQIVFLEDFGGGGTPQIVEAHPDAGGALVPVRGRSCSSSAMPFLREKFPSFHQFASASLDEIYPTEQLASALRREARVLESLILLNDGAGRFSPRPLPRRAQISPSFGAVFLHADGDPHLDLFLAQNFFGPQRETGRMDGGLGCLLLGDGEGGFLPLRADRSGIAIPGDATAAVSADVNADGRSDLLVAVNDSTIRAFANRADADGGRWLRLQLRDRNGSAICAGARVTLAWESTDRQTATAFEIHAGSGYLSQSDAAATLPPGPVARPGVIRVQWPDGSVSEHAATTEPTPDRSIIVLQQP